MHHTGPPSQASHAASLRVPGGPPCTTVIELLYAGLLRPGRVRLPCQNIKEFWRRRPDLNRGWRFCSPVAESQNRREFAICSMISSPVVRPESARIRPQWLAQWLARRRQSTDGSPFNFAAALSRSPSLTMLYRSNIDRVLCPVSFIATRSGMPARTMLRTAVRRRSCGMRPGQPSGPAGRRPGLREGEDAAAASSALRGPSATIRKNTHGTICPAFFSPSLVVALRLQERPQLVGQLEHAALAVLRRARVQPHLAAFEVDVAPLERQHLARDAPAGDVRERHDRPQLRRQVAAGRSRTGRARRTRPARCPPSASGCAAGAGSSPPASQA